MSDVEIRVRRYEPADREAVVLLAPRLETGVAGWRDRTAVRRAVTGWIEASLAGADADDREVFVAYAWRGCHRLGDAGRAPPLQR
jgi:hypothetical protein